MADEIRADICVIGAGAGGLSVASGAAQLGARVVLIEAARMGGDCLNTGCIPSKALLAASRRAGAGRMTPFAEAMAHVRDTIDTIAPHDGQTRFEGLGVRVLRGRATFAGPDRLIAGGQMIVARRFVIATGSVPVVPDIPGLDQVPYLTTDTLFQIAELPGHLVILGGGAVGAEMGEAFARLGAEVTIVEAARFLGREDADAADVVRQGLLRLGVVLHEGTPVRRVAAAGSAVHLHLADDVVVAGTHLLVATGRRPFYDGLNLEAAGIARDGGAIRTDRRLRTTNRRIYAVGDATGRAQTTAAAGHHAGVVVRRLALGLPAVIAEAHIPTVVHTDPALARIGPTQAEARARFGTRLQIVRHDFADLDRAIAEGRREGFCKLLVVRGRVVGVTIAGQGAGDLIAVWALLIAGDIKLSLQTSAVLPYPVLSEVSSRAASAYFAPKVFGNPWVRRFVRLVQTVIP